MKKKVIIFIVTILLILLVGGVIIMNTGNKKNNNINQNVTYVNGEFNLNLIKTVNSSKTENYLISPYSIEVALNLLKEGAQGNTLNELETVIGNRAINDVSIKNRVSVANAAFANTKYKKYILNDYYQSIKSKYNSEILYDEFKTPKIINDWVNKNTYGMIDKIIDKVDSNFALGLANALAIDVEWTAPFDCSSTRSQKFTKSNGKTINVQMMHKTLKYDTYKYLKNDLAEGVIIPYRTYNATNGEETYEDGRNLEFVAILPKDDARTYVNNLTESELADLESSAKEVSNDFEIDLALPRFKYDYTLDNFKEVLMQMGIIDIFSAENADFTKIMPLSVQSEVGNLYVGEAIHKTHIDLNEKGTKAAAVTYFGMYTSGMVMDVKSVDLVFDKPFIYMIRDAATKELLFFGLVYEPNKWEGSTCSSDE